VTNFLVTFELLIYKNASSFNYLTIFYVSGLEKYGTFYLNTNKIINK